MEDDNVNECNLHNGSLAGCYLLNSSLAVYHLHNVIWQFAVFCVAGKSSRHLLESVPEGAPAVVSGTNDGTGGRSEAVAAGIFAPLTMWRSAPTASGSGRS